jgi:hypothetical protein
MDHKEASQRWCPWRPLEYVKPGRGIANYRVDEGFELGTASRCVTFDCMAWRDNECIRLKATVVRWGNE